ncbi:YdcF family protein [Lederbergia lenta]|nr:YdcF family protein [Lederbergia lenta]MCM3112109.1 YdcF family protein [Lederbergia lenta]MEC2323279.1 YdcF family protein [Lederbergia lenta]
MIKKIISLSFLFILSLSIFLWMLTGKWMNEGKKPKANGKNEYAVILGAKVNGDVPSLSLQFRLDAALKYANTYPHVKLILSGGQGPGENITEAKAMKKFLVEKGISDDRLILEEKSTSTYENILFSKELLPTSVQSITIITSDFHLARAKKLADTLKLQSDVVSAKTPNVVEFKLTTRERLALLKTSIFGK